MSSSTSILADAPVFTSFALSDYSSEIFDSSSPLSTSYDREFFLEKLTTTMIVIGSKHTCLHKTSNELLINVDDAVVICDQAAIYNIEVLEACKRLLKRSSHVRIVIKESSQAAQQLHQRLCELIP